VRFFIRRLRQQFFLIKGKTIALKILSEIMDKKRKSSTPEFVIEPQ